MNSLLEIFCIACMAYMANKGETDIVIYLGFMLVYFIAGNEDRWK